MDLLSRDPPRDDNLPSLPIVRFGEGRCGYSGGNLLVWTAVMPDPNRFEVRDTEVDSDDGTLTAAFQLTQPLMRNVEISGYWYREDSAWV